MFVGYPTNQKGYLLLCPARGPNAIVSTTNCYFGTRLPYASLPAVELIPGSASDLPLPQRPAALNLEELRGVPDPQVIGTYQGHLVVSGSGWSTPRLLAPSDFMSALVFTHTNELSSAHLSLVESYNLMDIAMPADVFSQEVPHLRPVPKNLAAALSPQFVGEYGPAIDNENAGFKTHECLEVVHLQEGSKCVPTQWIFTGKRDASPKAMIKIISYVIAFCYRKANILCRWSNILRIFYAESTGTKACVTPAGSY